jgi:hypothetical protein
MLDGQPPLALVANDDHFTVPSGHALVVDDSVNRDFYSLTQVSETPLESDVAQMLVASSSGLLFLRLVDGRISVVDAASNSVVEVRAPRERFSDMDLTPDGKFLFAADFGGETPHPTKPKKASWVHRYDLEQRTWDVQRAPDVAWRIVAIDQRRFLLQSFEEPQENSINSYSQDGIVELFRDDSFTSGDLVYDSVRSRVIQGEGLDIVASGLTLSDLDGDELHYLYRSTEWDPERYDSDLLISTDGRNVYHDGTEFELLDVRNRRRDYHAPVLAAGFGVVFTPTQIWPQAFAPAIDTLPATMTAIGISADGRDVWATGPSEHDEPQLFHFELRTTGYGVLRNDTAPRGAPTGAELLTLPAHGTVTFDAQGTFVYRPAANFVGADSFTYRVLDGDEVGNSAFVSIDVIDSRRENHVPAVFDVRVTATAGVDLNINSFDAAAAPTADHLTSFPIVDYVDDIRFSAPYNLVFTRGIGYVAVRDAVTGSLLERRLADGLFTDFDLTPDGRYLLVVEDTTRTSVLDPKIYGTRVLRFDLKSSLWESVELPERATYVLAIRGDRPMLADERRVVLYDWPLSQGRLRDLGHGVVFAGDLEYDPATGLILEIRDRNVKQTVARFGFADDRLLQEPNPKLPLEFRGVDSALSSGGTYIYFGNSQREVSNLAREVRAFPETIHAANGSLASGEKSFFDATTGALLGARSFSSSVQHLSKDGRNLWIYDPAVRSRSLEHFLLGGRGVGVLATAKDDDGDLLQLEIVEPPRYGSLAFVDPSGRVVYRPRNGFVGQDAFRYRAFDGTAYSEVRTVTIDVLPSAADAPYIATSLDIDGDGMVMDATDGAMIGADSYLAIHRLVREGVGATGPRPTAPALIEYCRVGEQAMLDVDGSGAFERATDAVLISRYLQGLRGPELVSLHLPPGATRRTARDIESWIESFMPLMSGDVTGDSVVDENDIEVIQQHFGAKAARRWEGDLDDNRVVDLNDFALVKSNLGMRDPASPRMQAISPADATALESTSFEDALIALALDRVYRNAQDATAPLDPRSVSRPVA